MERKEKMQFELMASMMCVNYGNLEKEVKALEEGGYTVQEALVIE